MKAGDILPVGAPEGSGAGQQVAVAAGKGAAGQRPRTGLRSAGCGEVTPARVVCKGSGGDRETYEERGDGDQHKPCSPRGKESTHCKLLLFGASVTPTHP